MAETPTTSAAATAAKTAAKAGPKPIVDVVEVVAATDGLNKVLPTVVETSEVALELPTRVIVNQKLVFAVGVVGGMALGAGIMFGVHKYLQRKMKKDVLAAVEEAHKQADQDFEIKRQQQRQNPKG